MASVGHLLNELIAEGKAHNLLGQNMHPPRSGHVCVDVRRTRPKIAIFAISKSWDEDANDVRQEEQVGGAGGGRRVIKSALRSNMTPMPPVRASGRSSGALRALVRADGSQST